MDFRFTPEQETFRDEFAEWLKENFPDNWSPSHYVNFDSTDPWVVAYREFQRRLSEGGYAGMQYPKEYGGQGMTMAEEVLVLQTIAYTCFELRWPGIITHGMASPVIFIGGNEEQKREFMPKILDGTHLWCQGFSEPDFGSDAASIATRAERQGNDYVINGQKVWTSWANYADFCLLLVRTDPDVSRHKGLSYFLVDMKLPGIDVRPIQQITGEAEFNEVFFDDVRVPKEMLVGEEGKGWQVAMTTLMFERVLGDVNMGASYTRNIEILIEMAKQVKRSGKPIIEDPVFRQQLGQAYVEVMALSYHGLRNLSSQLKGEVPGPEGSIGKLLWSEPNQRICEAAIGMQGLSGQIMRSTPWTIQDGFWQYHFLRSKGNTIEGGTSEIQWNIIGERALGLPKDASRIGRK